MSNHNKGMVRPSHFFILFFILASLSVLADTSYTFPQNGSYAGINFWNSGQTSWNTATRGLPDTPQYPPLVEDFDGDGSMEIAVKTSTTFKIYHNHPLTIMDSLTVGSLEGTHSASGNIAYAKLNGTNYAIFQDKTYNVMRLITWNGTKLLQRNISLAGGGANIVSCDTDSCTDVYMDLEQDSGSAGDGAVYIQRFNETGYDAGSKKRVTSASDTCDSIGGYEEECCFNQIPMIAYKDINNDGVKDYVFSYVIQDSSQVHVVAYQTNSTNGYSNIYDTPISISNSAHGFCNTGTAKNSFTSPLVGDFDEAQADGLETVVGYEGASDGFNMKILGSNGAVIQTHPAITTTGGNLLGNPFIAKAFDDTSEINDPRVDYCLMGNDPTNSRFNILCGSQVHQSLFTGTIEYDYEPFPYNFSTGYGQYSMVTHSNTATSSDSWNGVDFDEILTSYGNYKLRPFELDPLGVDNILVPIWNNSVKNVTSLIMVDPEKIGRPDIIETTNTNVYYLDDGYTNSPAQIGSPSIDPCPEGGTMRINTTVNIQVPVSDPENNDVRAQAFLYAGTPYNQSSGWTAFFPSGTTFPFTFVANVTTPSAVILIQATDTVNNLTIVNDSIPFSVASIGNGAGEGTICNVHGSNTTTINASQAVGANLTANQADNVVRNTGVQIDEGWGLHIGLTALWVIFMLVVAIIIFIKHPIPTHSLGVVGFVEIGMLYLGWALGFIDGMVIVIFTIFGLIALGFMVVRMFSPQGG